MFKKNYIYENYTGNEAYIFAGCEIADAAKAVCIGEKLTELGVKLYFDMSGTRSDTNPEQVANAISSCETALFFISSKASQSLAYRNKINYALDLKKHIICICCDDKEIDKGIDMQLSNAVKLDFTGPGDETSLQDKIIEELKDRKIITQDVMGAEPKKKNTDRKKQIIFAAVIIIASALFAWGAVGIVRNRITYYQSAEWTLRNSDGSEYLNISEYGEDGISALKGKTIGEVDLNGSDVENLDGMADVGVTTLNISNCKNIHSLKPLLRCEGLKTVKLSPDMLRYAYGLLDSGIVFEVTE